MVEDGEGGTEFVDAEGGGFDEGQGTKNVSNEVEAEDLVCEYLLRRTYIHAHICRSSQSGSMTNHLSYAEKGKATQHNLLKSVIFLGCLSWLGEITHSN